MVMNLAFATKFPKGKPELEGKPTMFVEKILEGLNVHQLTDFNPWNEKVYQLEKRSLIDMNYLNLDPTPKIHTMRSDEKDRWKEGNNIHFVINNRQPNRFQFAPVIKCSGIEKVEIKWFEGVNNTFKIVRVYIGSKEIGCGVWNKGHETNPIFTGSKLIELSSNDGFDSVEEFFMWFNEDFTGKIIHWTPFRYVPEAIEVIQPEIIKKTKK